MRKVYIIGAYTTKFAKRSDVSFKQLTREAYLGAIQDASMETGDDIEFGFFANCAMHLWGQNGIKGQVCFIPLVRENLFPERTPIINVEGACASGSMAFQLAWKDIRGGFSEVAMAIGVEKMVFDGDKTKILKFLENGIDTFDREETLTSYKELAEKCGHTFAPSQDRSLYMDTYAIQALYHMQKYHTTQRQLAIAASKNHCNGSLNPKAQYQFKVTPDEVLSDREVSYPLTRSMCAPIGDGSAAAILCSGDFLKNAPSKVQNRAVEIAACTLTGGKYRGVDELSLSRTAADKAYSMANISPQDVDVAEVHDATSFAEIYQMEMLRFCPLGGAGRFIESGATSLEGKLPVNTSGGLVSKGHPIAATGLSMLYELTQQLRGEAGPRQVKNPEFALQENGGGVIGLEEAACSIIILRKDR